MDLRRYNEILIAVIGTVAVVGTVGLALTIVASGIFRDRFPEPQVDVREPGPGDRATEQTLVLCLPTPVADTDIYLIGVTVADASEPISRTILASGGSYEQSFSPSCKISERYQSRSQVQNAIVLDVESGEERLLLSHRALIQQFDAPDEECDEGDGLAPCDRLYWEIRPADTNGDGAIDADDAAVAYLSDLRASSLVRISPEGTNLVSITRDARRSKLLMQVQIDSNDDSAFTAADTIELFEYAYDSTRPPERLLSPAARAAASDLVLR